MQRKPSSPLEVDDTLLHIFSFFPATPKNLSNLENVDKQWRQVAQDDSLWLPLIRPESLEVFNESKLSAKEFYKGNIHARIHTLYCIGQPILVCKAPGIFSHITNKPELTHPSEKALLDTLQADQQGKYHVFRHRDEAIAYADALSETDEINFQTSISRIYKYSPIFTIHCEDLTMFEKAEDTELRAKKTSCHFGEDPSLHFLCYKVPSAKIIKLHDIFYKTGALPHLSRLNNSVQCHTIPITQPLVREHSMQPGRCILS